MVSTRARPEAPRTVVVEPAPREAPVVHEERPSLPRGEGLRVRRLVVATGVAAREPVGVADHFDRDEERLYAFVALANAGDATRVHVTFEPASPSRDAQVSGLVPLDVPAEVRRHRTWAWSRRVHAPGAWSAVVRDDDGRELARTTIEIE
jgi:hypothetical protein